MPSASSLRKPAVGTTRNARTANAKKASVMEEVDPIMNPSQSSSDDGVMATIAQQMQATMEKKKKEKEGRFLQAAQMELTRTISERAHEFANAVSEIDKIFSDFQDAYAANEDHIRKLWESIAKEQFQLQELVKEKQEAATEREKTREKEHIQALAHGRKACEEFQRLIDSLGSD